MSLRDAWEREARNWIQFATTPEHDRSFWRFGLPTSSHCYRRPDG
jgi:hypothetical protein